MPALLLLLDAVAGTRGLLGELIEYLPIFAFDGGRMDPVDVNTVMDWVTAGAGAAMLAKRWGSPRLIDLSEEVLTRLLADSDLLERLVARPAADTVAARLRELGVRRRPRRPRRATLATPAGLTARELDVLALLGGGLRNADIAGRLHISEKTVDHHVSAILAKLGVPSRRDASRAAAARGILPPDGS